MFNNQRTKRTFRFFDRAVSALNFIWFADYSYLLFARQPLFFTFLKLFYFVSFATHQALQRCFPSFICEAVRCRGRLYTQTNLECQTSFLLFLHFFQRIFKKWGFLRVLKTGFLRTKLKNVLFTLFKPEKLLWKLPVYNPTNKNFTPCGCQCML